MAFQNHLELFQDHFQLYSMFPIFQCNPLASEVENNMQTMRYVTIPCKVYQTWQRRNMQIAYR